MATPMLCFILFVLHTVSCSEKDNYRAGFMDRLNDGVQLAKDFFSSESVALKVAEFVVRAFQTNNRKPTPDRRQAPYEGAQDASNGDEIYAQESIPNSNIDEASSPMTPLRHLVRLFGLQPNQISAVAVNALVFVAQMISTFLAGPKRPSKPFRSDDPTSWILTKNSRNLQNLLAAAKDESLPKVIEELIKEQGSEEETSCIRLLVCKITPFVYKMQSAVFGTQNTTFNEEEKLRGAAAMYRHLPTADEINKRSDICEREHKDCDLNE